MTFSRIPHSGDVRDENGNLTKVGTPTNDDYEPTEFNDHRLERFGFFRTTRFNRDPHFGARESNRDHFANLHPIWKKVRDDNGQLIPVAQREPKPIVYYLNKQFPGANAPVNLVPEAQAVAAEWSEVLKEAVAAAQGKSMDDVPEMFVLCPNNPVQAGDDAVRPRGARGAHRGSPSTSSCGSTPPRRLPAGMVRRTRPARQGGPRTLTSTAPAMSAAASIVDLIRLLSGDLDQTRTRTAPTWRFRSKPPTDYNEQRMS